MTRPDRVAVVVVTYNSAPLLADLVASLPAGMAGTEWELVVADNASRDASIETVRRLAPGAHVVEVGRNGGYSAGINAAVGAASPHDAVLILNPDVRLRPGCGRALVEALRRPGVGISVPRLENAAGELIFSLRREPTLARAVVPALIGAERAGRIPAWGEVVTDRRSYTVEGVADWAEGSTQMVSARCWRACGPWDESFFLYSEETEFDLRARDHGFALSYVPSAIATHLEGGSTNPQLWSLLVLNRFRLFRRRNGKVASAGFWLASLAHEAVRGALDPRGGRGQASRAAVRALLDPRRWSRPDAAIPR